MARIEDYLGARLSLPKGSARMVTLVATQAYSYAQHSVAVGELFEASEKDAALLKLLGKAEDPPVRSRQMQTRDLEPESDAATSQPSTRRKYQRRDLTPEA